MARRDHSLRHFVVSAEDRGGVRRARRLLRSRGIAHLNQAADPAPVSRLPYGELPYASYRVSLRNGRQPTREVVEQAAESAYAKLKARFGAAALDLNGTLIGEL